MRALADGSVGHVEVFQMAGVRTSILGRPRPLPGDRRAASPYTLICEEPPNVPLRPEPVIITDRGKPSHVLLSIEQYHRLVSDQRSIVDWLSAEDDIDLEPHRIELALKTPDL